MPLQFAFYGNEQWLDPNGAPASGYHLFTYLEGSTTKEPVYTDILGTAQHTNPILLNASGRPPAPIYLDYQKNYKFVLAPPTDTDPPTSPIWTADNIRPRVPDGATLTNLTLTTPSINGGTLTTPSINGGTLTTPRLINPFIELGGHGTARLDYVSATSVQLGIGQIPLLVNGAWQQRAIPSPITLSTSGLSADTDYYVYAYDASGATVLEASTTAPTMEASGVSVKTGDASRTLVGLVGLTGAAQFEPDMVLSWFNKRLRVRTRQLNQDYSTASTNWTEVWSGIRIMPVVWSGATLLVGVAGGGMINSSGLAQGQWGVGLDGVVSDAARNYREHGTNSNGYWVPLGITSSFSGLAPGRHTLSLYYQLNAGSNIFTWGGTSFTVAWEG